MRRTTTRACAAIALLLSLLAAAQAVSVTSRSPHSHSSRQPQYKPTHEEIVEAEESAAAAARESIEDTFKTAVVDVGPPPNDHTADIDPDTLAPRAKDVPDFLVNHTHSRREQDRIKQEEHSMINPMSERYLHILDVEEHSLPPAAKTPAPPAHQEQQLQSKEKHHQQHPAPHHAPQQQQKHHRPVNRMPPPTPHYRPAPRRYLVTARHAHKPKHAADESNHHPAVGMATVVRTVGADGKERQVSTIDTNDDQSHEQPQHGSASAPHSMAASATVIRTVGAATDADADAHPIVSHSDPNHSIQYQADGQAHDETLHAASSDGKEHEVLMKSPFPISKRAQNHKPHVASVKENKKKKSTHVEKKKVEHRVATAHWKPHHAHRQTHKPHHSLAEVDSEIRPSSMPSRQRTASPSSSDTNNAAASSADDADSASLPQFRTGTRSKSKLKVRAAPSCQGLSKKLCKPCSGAMPGPPGKMCDDEKEACGNLFCMPMCTKLLWKVGTTADGAEEPLSDEFKDEVESEPVQAALQAHFITRGCVDKLECCDKERMWDYVEDFAFGSNYGQPVMPIKGCKHDVENAELSAKFCAACNAAVKVKSEPLDCPDEIKQGPANDDGTFIDIAERWGVPRHVSSKYGMASAKPYAAQRFGVTLLELGFGSDWSEARVQKKVNADGSATFTPFRNERQRLRAKHTYFKHRGATRSDRKMRFVAHRAEVLANARKAQVATRLMLLQEKEKLKRSPPDSARAKFLQETLKSLRHAEEITRRHEQQLIETQERIESDDEELEELNQIAENAKSRTPTFSPSTTSIRQRTSSATLPISPSLVTTAEAVAPVPRQSKSLSSFAEVDSWERSLRSSSRLEATDASSRGFAAAQGKLAVVKPLDVGPPKHKNFWERCKQLEPIVHGMLGGFDADFQGAVCGCLGCCPMVPCFYRTSIQNPEEIESSEDDWE